MENINSNTLEFEVINQLVKRKDRLRPVANSKNFLYAHFTFTEDWNGLEKQAIFTYNNIVMKCDLKEDNTCIVPSDVIKPESFYVGVVGRLNDEEVIVPTEKAIVGVTDSIPLDGSQAPVRYVESETLTIEKNGDLLRIELSDELLNLIRGLQK